MKAEINESILDLIGNTPVVRLKKLPDPCGAQVLVKVESFNPGGSVKDRIALTMVEDAEERGLLKPGGTIIEGTSGNTGLGLAMVSAVKGYKCIIVVTDKQSREKVGLLKAFGANVVIAPATAPPDSPEYVLNRARRLSEETPNSIMADQFINPVNPETHYKTTGPELWRQCGGKIDAIVAGMGTGGTITGIAKYLKEKNPDIRVIGADPYGSVLKTFKDTGELIEAKPYLVEGIGEDIIPETLNLDIVDEIVNVHCKDSLRISRRLTREEGILSGGSAGTLVFVALEYAKTLSPEKVVATLVPDTGERYLSKHHSDDWMNEHGLLND